MGNKNNYASSAGLLEIEEALRGSKGFPRVADNKAHISLGQEVSGFSNIGDHFDRKPVSHNVVDRNLPKER